MPVESLKSMIRTFCAKFDGMLVELGFTKVAQDNLQALVKVFSRYGFEPDSVRLSIESACKEGFGSMCVMPLGESLGCISLSVEKKRFGIVGYQIHPFLVHLGALRLLEQILDDQAVLFDHVTHGFGLIYNLIPSQFTDTSDLSHLTSYFDKTLGDRSDSLCEFYREAIVHFVVPAMWSFDAGSSQVLAQFPLLGMDAGQIEETIFEARKLETIPGRRGFGEPLVFDEDVILRPPLLAVSMVALLLSQGYVQFALDGISRTVESGRAGDFGYNDKIVERVNTLAANFDLS